MWISRPSCFHACRSARGRLPLRCSPRTRGPPIRRTPTAFTGLNLRALTSASPSAAERCKCAKPKKSNESRLPQIVGTKSGSLFIAVPARRRRCDADGFYIKVDNRLASKNHDSRSLDGVAIAGRSSHSPVILFLTFRSLRPLISSVRFIFCRSSLSPYWYP